MTQQQEQSDIGLAEIRRQKQLAFDARDLVSYLIYSCLLRDLERAGGFTAPVSSGLAKHLYADNQDEEAWIALFEALSSAGLL